MATLEKDVERRLVQMVERHGGLCLKWTCPGWAGVPDRIILLPWGRVLFCELKRPSGGRLAAVQSWWARRLKSRGFTIRLVNDDASLALLELEIKRIMEEDTP